MAPAELLQEVQLQLAHSIIIDIPVVEYPSCLQATVASGVPQKSSQTVPQALLLQISTRPS